MEEKQLQNTYEQSLNKQHLDIWQQELQKKIDRESREAEHKKKLNEETAQAIKEQMALKEKEAMAAQILKQQQIAERVSKLGEVQAMEQAKLEQKMKDLELKRVSTLGEV